MHPTIEASQALETENQAIHEHLAKTLPFYCKMPSLPPHDPNDWESYHAALQAQNACLKATARVNGASLPRPRAVAQEKILGWKERVSAVRAQSSKPATPTGQLSRGQLKRAIDDARGWQAKASLVREYDRRFGSDNPH